jgi:hypothetical protein
MTLRVPDHSLNIDRVALAEFLINFARFEYAIKAAGYSRNNNGYAEPDWENYCSSLTTDFWSAPDADLGPPLRYIRHKPPKKLVKLVNGELRWKPRTLDATWSEPRKVLFLAQGVRNNVVHGSKFIARESAEHNRNAKLMAAATAILIAFLSHSNDVREVFDGYAP